MNEENTGSSASPPLLGNPFGGANPQNPSLTGYINFLKSVLQGGQQNSGSNGGKKPANTKQETSQGPKKWNGPNAMEISKGFTPTTMTPQKPPETAPSSPFEMPSMPQQEVWDPYKIAAAMNQRTASGGWGLDSSINTHGYQMGGVTAGSNSNFGTFMGSNTGMNSWM